MTETAVVSNAVFSSYRTRILKSSTQFFETSKSLEIQRHRDKYFAIELIDDTTLLWQAIRTY